MTAKATEGTGGDPSIARRKLEDASSLHWFHWTIVGLSLALTFFAWNYSQTQLETRVQAQFDRETNHVINLVQERMQKYEDALWGGVALIDASGGEVSFQHWKTYAESLQIETKYPGINGIGVVHRVPESEVDTFQAKQRRDQPGYKIYPPHEQDERYPITYIIPLEGNEQAVGLDMAHEENRYTAAKKSRDEGSAKITGPITLVQDSGKTPGFLFYAPFYERGSGQHTVSNRRERFSGLVYAPFVVKNLMAGALGSENRLVGVRISDGQQVIYDEHTQAEIDFDPNPLLRKSFDVPLYGRTWRFDIWSAISFRKASSDAQPTTILIGGIVIDAILIVLFVMISRASRGALQYADQMTHQLQNNAAQLEENRHQLAQHAEKLQQSNLELEQFAYVASHDLQEPVRKVATLCQLLQDKYGTLLDDDGNRYLTYAVTSANRMRTLVKDLLWYSKIKSDERELTCVNTQAVFESVLMNLEDSIEESGATITHDPLPTVVADSSQLSPLLQNLIGNGIKYRRESVAPKIHVGFSSRESDWLFSVRDNGIGIEEKYFQRIFEIFKRLHRTADYPGTGIGLAICMRVVDRWGGKIWLESEEGVGSTFFFTLPKLEESVVSDDSSEDQDSSDDLEFQA